MLAKLMKYSSSMCSNIFIAIKIIVEYNFVIDTFIYLLLKKRDNNFSVKCHQN